MSAMAQQIRDFVTLKIPKEVISVWKDIKRAEDMVSKAAVIDLIRKEKITVSRGAEMLKMPIQDFMELLSKEGISLWDESIDELKEDEKTLKRVFVKTSKKS
jgi:predicted HTH domain antitoxin